jgi:hypothetical protein
MSNFPKALASFHTLKDYCDTSITSSALFHACMKPHSVNYFYSLINYSLVYIFHFVLYIYILLLFALIYYLRSSILTTNLFVLFHIARQHQLDGTRLRDLIDCFIGVC